MKEYLENSQETYKIRKHVERLSREEEMEEFMILGLRMNAGVSEEAFAKRFQMDIYEVYGEVLRKYCAQEFLKREEGRIFFTREGISVSNVILADFLG